MREIWTSFPQDEIDRLVLSFQNRVELIIEQEGKSITDILRNGIHQSPKDNIIINENYSILTIEDLIQKCEPDTNDCPIEFLIKKIIYIRRRFITLKFGLFTVFQIF